MQTLTFVEFLKAWFSGLRIVLACA